MRQLKPHEQKARAARLRRIVRNGEELLKLLASMREDVYHEFIDQIHGTDRWEQRRDDYWDDLERFYGNLQRMIPGKVESARRELRGLGEPENFTRKQAEPEKREPKQENERYSRILEEALEEDRGIDLEVICNL